MTGQHAPDPREALTAEQREQTIAVRSEQVAHSAPTRQADTDRAVVEAVEALAATWQGELDSGAIRDKDARYCWDLAVRELRTAIAAASEPTSGAVEAILAARQRPTDPADGLTEDERAHGKFGEFHAYDNTRWPAALWFNEVDVLLILAARQRPTDPESTP
jgi:hypothetical protein